MSKFRPMLAGKADPAKVKFPVLVSPKLDGIRAVVIDSVVYSRSMKPIRNEHVQRLFGREGFNGFDGELIVGEPTDPDVYRKSSSGVMSKEGEPDVVFCVFDNIYRKTPYYEWYTGKEKKWQEYNMPATIKLVPHYTSVSEFGLSLLEREAVSSGYEGVMVRSLDGPYKQGRSTVKEGYLLKLKTFEDSEAEIIGFEELMHNNNEAEMDERGYTKRSSSKDFLEGADTLGALIVKDIHTEVEFRIGTGFTAEDRKTLWDCKEGLLPDLIVKYKFFPGGVKDKPRFPVFLGFRDPEDLS